MTKLMDWVPNPEWTQPGIGNLSWIGAANDPTLIQIGDLELAAGTVTFCRSELASSRGGQMEISFRACQGSHAIIAQLADLRRQMLATKDWPTPDAKPVAVTVYAEFGRGSRSGYWQQVTGQLVYVYEVTKLHALDGFDLVIRVRNVQGWWSEDRARESPAAAAGRVFGSTAAILSADFS